MASKVKSVKPERAMVGSLKGVATANLRRDDYMPYNIHEYDGRIVFMSKL
jgi:hypothetical protein